MEQEYFILDNYSKPYKVIIGQTNNVQVYKLEDADDEIQYKLILSIQALKVFVGKSPLIPMTEFSGGHGQQFDGNSILLQQSEYSYIWIGEKIISFLSYFPIVEYISPVGNNQVTYPWAIDEKGWVYLFLCNVVITNIPESNLADPYDYFWFKGLGNICGPECYQPSTQTLIKNFQSIKKFFIGNEEYRFVFSAYPDKEYDRLVQSFDSELYVEKTDGNKYKLDKSSFINLMKDFAEQSGLCVLDHMNVIDKGI